MRKVGNVEQRDVIHCQGKNIQCATLSLLVRDSLIPDMQIKCQLNIVGYQREIRH